MSHESAKCLHLMLFSDKNSKFFLLFDTVSSSFSNDRPKKINFCQYFLRQLCGFLFLASLAISFQVHFFYLIEISCEPPLAKIFVLTILSNYILYKPLNCTNICVVSSFRSIGQCVDSCWNIFFSHIYLVIPFDCYVYITHPFHWPL